MRYVIGGLILLGIFLMYWGGTETSLWVSGTTEPVDVTVAELGSGESIDNCHVHVTDFLIAEDYVAQEKKNSTDIQTAWLVALKPDGEVTKQPVIFETGGDDMMEIILGESNGQGITGIVTDGDSRLASDKKKILKQSFAHVDFDHTVIVRTDRGFPNIFLAIGAIVLGLISAVIGGVIGLASLRSE